MSEKNRVSSTKLGEEEDGEEHTTTMDMTWNQTGYMMIPLDTPTQSTVHGKKRRTSILVDSSRRENLGGRGTAKRRVSFAPTAHVRIYEKNEEEWKSFSPSAQKFRSFSFLEDQTKRTNSDTEQIPRHEDLSRTRVYEREDQDMSLDVGDIQQLQLDLKIPNILDDGRDEVSESMQMTTCFSSFIDQNDRMLTFTEKKDHSIELSTGESFISENFPRENADLMCVSHCMDDIVDSLKFSVDEKFTETSEDDEMKETLVFKSHIITAIQNEFSNQFQIETVSSVAQKPEDCTQPLIVEEPAPEDYIALPVDLPIADSGKSESPDRNSRDFENFGGVELDSLQKICKPIDIRVGSPSSEHETEWKGFSQSLQFEGDDMDTAEDVKSRTTSKEFLQVEDSGDRDLLEPDLEPPGEILEITQMSDFEPTQLPNTNMIDLDSENSAPFDKSKFELLDSDVLCYSHDSGAERFDTFDVSSLHANETDLISLKELETDGKEISLSLEHLESNNGMSLSEFLRFIDVRFLDTLTTTIRRETLGHLRNAAPIADVRDMVHASCLTIPEAEIYRFGCGELADYVFATKKSIEKFEFQLDDRRPPIFKQIMNFDYHKREDLQGLMKTLKNSARLSARKKWYEWREKLVDSLYTASLDYRSQLLKDHEMLQENLLLNVQNADSLRIYRDRLTKVLVSLRKIAEKRRKNSLVRDPEQLMELEKAIDEQQSQIRAFSKEVELIQKEYFEEKRRNAEHQRRKIISLNLLDDLKKRSNISNSLTEVDLCCLENNFILGQSLCYWQLLKTTEETAEFMYDDLILVLIDWAPTSSSTIPKLVSNVRIYIMPHPELDTISTTLFRAATRGADMELIDQLSMGPLRTYEVLSLISEKLLRAAFVYRDLLEVWQRYSLCFSNEKSNTDSGVLQITASFSGWRTPHKYDLVMCLDFRSTTYPYGSAFENMQPYLVYNFSAHPSSRTAKASEIVNSRDFSGLNQLQRFLHAVSSTIS